MKYLGVTALAIVAVAIAFQFVQLVPGAMEAGQFTKDFWLNAFFMVVGFLVTTAAISPLVAWYLEWRSDVSWREARLNTRDRFAKSLNTTLEAYQLFLSAVREGDQHGVAGFHIAKVHQGLTDLFDTYESEQATFNADMHSAASNIRHHLLPFKRALESTDAMISRMRPIRMYVGEKGLNDLRSVFEQPALAPGDPIEHNRYFAEFRELYFDVRLDRQHGAGVIAVYSFVGINRDRLRSDWAKFVKASPSRADSPKVSVLQTDLQTDEDAQAHLHADYVRQHIKETYLANALLSAPMQGAKT